MVDKQTLQLGGGDLEALIFDQLLDTVGNEEVAVGVLVSDVTGLEVAVFGERLLGQFRLVEIALEHVWPLNGQFTILTVSNFRSVWTEIFGRHVGKQFSNRSNGLVPIIPRLNVGCWASL